MGGDGHDVVECADITSGCRYYASSEEWLAGVERYSIMLKPGGMVTSASRDRDKIALFRSLFRGRGDMYAHGYRRKDGGIAYAPACANDRVRGVCPRVANWSARCAECEARVFFRLSDAVLTAHFIGSSERFRDVVGMYVMDADETVSVLVADFDKGDWKEAAAAYRNAARGHGIDVALERSRSGEGAHAWIFFDGTVTAKAARVLGISLLTEARRSSRAIDFDSYDRLFPSQDTLPAGGFGSLIALPLQGRAVREGNSVFVDDGFRAYPDQWAYLSSVRKLSSKRVGELIGFTAIGETGHALTQVVLQANVSSSADGALVKSKGLQSDDFPTCLSITRSDMLYVPETGLSGAALAEIEQLAAYGNPEFFRAQAQHRSVYGKQRFIHLGEKRGDSIALPRGCEDDLLSLLNRSGAQYVVQDERFRTKCLDIEFAGTLRPRQQDAANALLSFDTGILSAPTGFGKTVIGAYLIGAVKQPALVIVPRTALLSQWIEKLGIFLNVNEEPPALLTPSGKISKRKRPRIGQIGGGKNKASGIVDVATFQSLIERGDDGASRVKELVRSYGLVICDECHHAAAPQLESVLKAIPATKVYGLSATPKRADGLDRSLRMLCGPIRYRIDPKEQAEQQGFARVLRPRFTNMKYPDYRPGMSFNQILDLICVHPARNALIVDDVIGAIEKGRTSLVVTRRKDHARNLARLIENAGCKVHLLVGEGAVRDRRRRLEEVASSTYRGPFAIVATTSYLGEGFDLPQLEALFLGTPIAWDGSVVQQSGRLHREYEGKTSVIVYDYVDATIPVLDRMYKKRLKTYASLAYELFDSEDGEADVAGSFVDAARYRKLFKLDCDKATRSIVLQVPYVSEKCLQTLVPVLRDAVSRGVTLTCAIYQFERKSLEDDRFERSRRALERLGCNVTVASDIHPGLAVFDDKVVWYGTLPLLGFPQADDCSLRFASAEVAHELIGSSLPAGRMR